MTDAVDRSMDSPIADSASSPRGCCAQCWAGRIPVGLNGFAGGDGVFPAEDFTAGDVAVGEGVVSGALPVMLGKSSVLAAMKGEGIKPLP